MRTKTFISAITLMGSLIACKSQSEKTELITINVEKNYPKKELILQDFVDVEYIPLETTDEFINKGIVKAVGKNYIAVVNGGNEGDIFLYNRSNGKGVRKINRKGQGGEEYSQITQIVLDEEQNEMFIVDYPRQKFMVYNLEGKFLRDFNFDENSYYTFVYPYDKAHLIVYKDCAHHGQPQKSCHAIISKQDGKTIREISLSYKELEDIRYTGMHEKYGEITAVPAHYLTIPARKDWYLASISSDTIYRHLPNGDKHPYMVRTPSINSMDPEVFLFPKMMTEQYDFLVSIKKRMTEHFSFPSENLIYDKQEKAVYTYTIQNTDFEGSDVAIWESSLNPEVASYRILYAHDLVEAYEEGKLKGRLKEIASTLDEEDNPVIMLMKQK